MPLARFGKTDEVLLQIPGLQRHQMDRHGVAAAAAL
jgi:hypothetical protein